MKTIYIDTECKCHVTGDGTMTAVVTDFFDGKCDAFIEGYRLVPEGKIWVREDGRAFRGLMIAPWKDIRILRAYQQMYEAMTAASAETLAKAAAHDILMEGESTE